MLPLAIGVEKVKFPFVLIGRLLPLLFCNTRPPLERPEIVPVIEYVVTDAEPHEARRSEIPTVIIITNDLIFNLASVSNPDS